MSGMPCPRCRRWRGSIVCAASIAGRAAPVVSAAIVAAALWFAAPGWHRLRPRGASRISCDRRDGRESPRAPGRRQFLRISRCFGRSRPLHRPGHRWSRSSRGAAASGSGRWTTGVTAGAAPVWFLADPKRTDLALIDPQSRRDVTRYRWSVARPSRPERHQAAGGGLVSDCPAWLVCRRRVGPDPGDGRDRAKHAGRAWTSGPSKATCGDGRAQCTC